MGECFMFGRGMLDLWKADATFANNSWEDIIKACQKRKIPKEWAVGDQKAMTIDGTDYLIDIIGFDHDDYSDGSGKAPITFQMHECFRYNYCHSNATTNTCGWDNSIARTDLAPARLSQMPSAVQSAVKEVNKLTSAGGRSTTIETTADTLFLLSEVEIFGTVKNSASGEGSQYAYYANGGSKIKSSKTWWTRSPVVSSSSTFCLVSDEGKATTETTNYNHGISFAFCF